jgi:hypothetical protein
MGVNGKPRCAVIHYSSCFFDVDTNTIKCKSGMPDSDLKTASVSWFEHGVSTDERF